MQKKTSQDYYKYPEFLTLANFISNKKRKYELKGKPDIQIFKDKLIINGIPLNIYEIDLLYGLYVATKIWLYKGVKEKLNKDLHNNIIKNKLVIKKGVNIEPTKELDKWFLDKEIFKTLDKFLLKTPTNNLPYNSFYELYKKEF